MLVQNSLSSMGPLTTFLVFISDDKHIGMDVSVSLTGFIQLTHMPTGTCRYRERKIKQNLIFTKVNLVLLNYIYFDLFFFLFLLRVPEAAYSALKICDLSLKPLVRLVYNLAPYSKQGKTTLHNFNLTVKTAPLSMHIPY